ncbi:MAG: PaaI family thioesterase [Pseudomonadota bacterium]
MPPDTADVAAKSGAHMHHRALERLYASAPINNKFQSTLEIPGEGVSSLHFTITEDVFHAAGAAHGTIYFKMLDDAAFYAANTLSTDFFLLTTSFNMNFTKPVRAGDVIAEGRWVSGKRRVFVAESRLIDGEGDEIGRGTGTFMRSRIALSGLPGYSEQG